MAERTTQSWTTIPHFFVSRNVDATALNQYRSELVPEIVRSHNIKITHTDLLVALASRVLLKHPRVNSSWTTNGIRLHEHVNMGIAIAVNDGVVAAVIPNAHKANLPEIAQQRREVAERAKAGKLRPADISDHHTAASCNSRSRRHRRPRRCGRRQASGSPHDDIDLIFRSSRRRWRPRGIVPE
jgi:pyruvate dehydrogenase E2 component (dihydrolipoamide acetyltransferase)